MDAIHSNLNKLEERTDKIHEGQLRYMQSLQGAQHWQWSVPRLSACKEERAGSWGHRNQWMGQRVPSGAANLTREADMAGSLPGATAEDLNGP